MPDVRLSSAAPSRAPVTPKQAGIGAAALLALSLATTAIARRGLVLTDARDLAKVPTACYGHTGDDVHPGQKRTPAECDTILHKDVQRELAGVTACVPQIADRPYQLAAATRLTHNIGISAFCHSGAASAFRRGLLARGCDLFLPWDKAHVDGRIVQVPGLAARRQRERAMCLVGLT